MSHPADASRAAEAAALMVSARRDGAPPLPPLPDTARPRDLAEAEAIQHAIVRAEGGGIAGWKIGRLAPHVFSAPLPAQRLILAGPEQPPELRLPRGALAEIELALRFRRDLPADAAPRVQDLPELADLVLFFELVHSRFADPSPPGLDRLADSMANHWSVVAPCGDPWTPDMLESPSGVRMTADGAAIAQHDGPHPALPFAVVLDGLVARCRRDNHPIRAGDVVTLGSLGGAPRIPDNAALLEGQGAGRRIACRVRIAG